MEVPDKKKEGSFGMCMNPRLPGFVFGRSPGFVIPRPQGFTVPRPPGFVIPRQPQEIARQNDASPLLPLQKFACRWGTCGAVFNTVEDVENHIVHEHVTKTPPYICHWSKCRRNGHDFAQFYLYVNHIRTHTSRDLHACSVPGCGRRYRSIDNLRNHMVTHALPKPIPCSIVGCYRTFNNVVERGKHVSRAHSNVKRFMCPMLDCRKRYSDPSSLRKHLKGLHGEPAYAVFRELKNSVRLWEKNFRVQSNSEGNAHVVGVNGEEINFEEIINHVPDISEAEMMHHQNIGDLDDEGGFSDDSADVSYNYDVKTSPMFYPYAPPASFYQMPPMFVYPMPGQQGAQEKGGTSSSKPSSPTEQQQQSIPTGQMFPTMGFPAFAPPQPSPSNSQKPSSPVSGQPMYSTVPMMPYFPSMPGMSAAYGYPPNPWTYQINEEDEGRADQSKSEIDNHQETNEAKSLTE